MKDHDLEQLAVMLKGLGQAYMEKGRAGDAVERFETMIKLGITDADVYIHLSQALAATGRTDSRAQEVLQHAARLAPESREVILAAASVFLQSGRRDPEAQQIYEKAVAYDPPTLRQLGTVLAQLYYEQGRYDRCRVTARHLLARFGYDETILDLFLCSCRHLNAHDPAISELKRLIDVGGDKEHILRHLAAAYLEKKSARHGSTEPFLLSPTDLRHCQEFLQLSPPLTRIEDVVLRLDVRRMILDTFSQTEEMRQQLEPIASLDLSDIVSTLGESQHFDEASPIEFAGKILRGLEALEALSNRACLARHDTELAPFEEMGGDLSKLSPASARHVTLERLKGVLVLFISNFEELCLEYGADQAHQAVEKFTHTVAGQLHRHSLRSAWCAADGLIVLVDDLEDALRFSIRLLRSLERYNFVADGAEQVHLKVALHRFRFADEPTPMRFLGDLSLALKTAAVDWTETETVGRPVDSATLPSGGRILLTQYARSALSDQEASHLHRLGRFRLRHEPKYVTLHQAMWRDPAHDLQVGLIQRLGKFDLEDELASGPIFRTYRGQDSVLKRPVIVKILQPAPLGRLAAEDEVRQRYERRTREVARLSHPHLANIYEVAEDQGVAYVVREAAEGISLGEIMSSGRVLDSERLLTVLLPVLQGLAYAHQKGVAHGNLHPGNIWVNGPEIKLTDFDLGSHLFSDSIQDAVGGKDAAASLLAYGAPERLRGLPPTPAGDIFSMAAIMYEALTGNRPFESADAEKIAHTTTLYQPPPPSAVREDLPPEYDAVILRGLAEDPNERFSDIRSMLKSLRAMQNDGARHPLGYYLDRGRTPS